MRMLIATPKRWFSWDFEVHKGGGQPVGDVRVSAWRERGAVTVGGIEYPVTREGVVGAFTLSDAGGVLARAVKPSALHRMFTLEHDGKEYVLKAASAWGRDFALLDGEVQIGAVRPARLFGRQARAELPEDMSLEVRLFVIWLTLMLWKRQQQAANSS
jgi:hypothetical protein